MPIDIIEFYMYCESTPADDCFEFKCKYEWYCTTIKFASRFTTMIYSEGE